MLNGLKRGFLGGPLVKNPPAMQGTWIRPQVWEDRTCLEAAEAVCHSYCACAPEPKTTTPESVPTATEAPCSRAHALLQENLPQ